MNHERNERPPLAPISSNRRCILIGNSPETRPSSKAKSQQRRTQSLQHSRQRSRSLRIEKLPRSVSIPTTDPAAIKSLWATVSKEMEKRAEQQKGQLGTRRGGVHTSASGLPRRNAQTVSDVDSVTESNSSSRTRALRPQQHSAFARHILAPRHIIIDGKARITRGPFAHFGTKRPSSYQDLDRLAATRILLHLEQHQEEEIAANYDFMRAKRLCEAEFATYAMETFFFGEPRSAMPGEDRLWRAERMLQLVCPPIEDAHWLKPPLIEEDVARSDDYSWDVRPDCAYWISTRGFNEEYVHNVKGACFVHQDWILCPYLTVEFKRDSEDISAAQTQAATAGAMALYNRYRLHGQAHPQPTTLTGLVHYAITFTGPCYTIWDLRPNNTDHRQMWHGCCMRFLDQGDCTRKFDVKRLVDWINEIHRWGLSIHAPTCETDVKRVLREEGIDTSTIE